MRSPTRRLSADIDPAILGIPVPDLDATESHETSVSLTERRYTSQPSFLQGFHHILPVLDVVSTIPRISAKTVCDCLNGEYDDWIKNLFIIDCRFAYEYNGGHIRGATNIFDPGVLKLQFFDQEPKDCCVIIFHCEFSHNRGPAIAQLFREMDRFINKKNHPYVTYPDVYVLEGGYKDFYSKFPDMCDGSYQPMSDDKFISNGSCVKAMAEFKKAYDAGLKAIRRPLLRSTNSQRSFNSPTVFQTRAPSSPLTTRHIAKFRPRLDF